MKRYLQHINLYVIHENTLLNQYLTILDDDFEKLIDSEFITFDSWIANVYFLIYSSPITFKYCVELLHYTYPQIQGVSVMELKSIGTNL